MDPRPAPLPSAAPAPAAPVRAARSLAPDVARGLMLALIAVANVSWYLWGTAESAGMTPHVPATGPLDTVVQVIMTIAVDHRAMPLFAMLFGYGMVQFARSRAERGMDPRAVRTMLRRRHWAMLLLGLLHAALLFYGDILGTYALAGLVLVWWFFGRTSRTLRIWVTVLTILLALGALLSILAGVTLSLFAPPEVLGTMEAGMEQGGTGTARPLAYGEPYLPSVLYRLSLWAAMTPIAAITTAPLPILLGWLAARRRILDEPWRHVGLLRRIAVVGIGIGWLGGVPEALAVAGVMPLPAAAPWMLTALTSLAGVACGAGYAAAFGLLALRLEGREPRTEAPAPARGADRDLLPAERAIGVAADVDVPPRRRAPGRVERALAAVGQRSLSSYLFQSLLLAPIMASWGLGLGGHLGTAAAVGIALLVWLASLPLAAWLEAHGRRGPAEALLRRMTYGRRDRAPRSRRA